MLGHLNKHWRSWLIAILIVIVAPAVVWFSDAFQQCMDKCYYESANYEPEKGIRQIFSTLGWAKTCTGQCLKEDGGAITAFFTLVVGFFTAALWLSTRALWQVTTDTLEHSERTAIRELRAYVSVDEILMEQFRGPDMVATTVHQIIPGPVRAHRISALLKNGGQTPTRKAIVNANHELRDAELPSDFDFPDGKLTESAAIGPGGIFGTPSFFISNSDAEEIVSKKKRLYVWGWIDYDDVFENTPRHRTEFCFDISPDEVPDKGNIYLRFPTHGRFNGIDGDCVRQPRPYEEPGRQKS